MNANATDSASQAFENFMLGLATQAKVQHSDRVTAWIDGGQKDGPVPSIVLFKAHRDMLQEAWRAGAVYGEETQRQRSAVPQAGGGR